MLCADGRQLLNQKTFTFNTPDPNHYTYCNQFQNAGVCLDPHAPGKPQYDTGLVLKENAITLGNTLTCHGLINWKLNSGNALDSELLGIGCPIYTDSTHRYVKCSFSDDLSTLPSFSGCVETAAPPFNFLVSDCNFTWTCNLEAPDDAYRTLCCNGKDINVFSGTDPLTGLAFRGEHMCAPNWCLSDPYLECLDVWEPCDSTASCGRHSLLTPHSPVSSTDLLLNSIEIIGADRGLQCNAFYEEVKVQAFNLANVVYSNFTESMVRHIQELMIMEKRHCSDPTTKGNGECACLNGYSNANVPVSENGILDSYANSAIPRMLVQDSKGKYRRVDAYCEYGPTWVDALSYSSGGSWTTYSNACSSTLFWSETEYMRPTLNPIGSAFANRNFGDLNIQPDGFGGQPSNAMPLHCWLPACVGTTSNGQSNFLVFNDLYAFTQTCPSVCYMYSAGSSVNVNDVNDSFINIGSNFQGCSFGNQGYALNYDPFLLKAGCESLYITAPVNFSGFINLLVSNPTHDNALAFLTRTVNAYSNIQQVQFWNDGVPSLQFASQTIWKYKAEDVLGSAYSSTANLKLYVNTSNTSPWTSFQSEIVLYDEDQFFQSIQVQLYVYPDAAGAGGTSFSAQVCGNISSFNPTTGAIVCSQTCDCEFGASSLSQNCPDIASFPFKDRIQLSNTLTGKTVLSAESIRSIGAAQSLLKAHVQLYG